MRRPQLLIFAGLPGVGKTTLSQQLTARCGWVHLRIDTIEQGLRELCGISVEGEGYRLAYRIAADNLRLGNSVIADCCNPIALTRREWCDVAESTGARAVGIEIICSEVEAHRHRVEERAADIAGLALPDWAAVQARGYQPWQEAEIRIDTAASSPAESLDALLSALENAAIFTGD